MKRTSCVSQLSGILIILLIAVQVSGDAGKGGKEKPVANPESDEAPVKDQVHTNWSHYSYGLFFKRKAVESSTREEAKYYLTRAIQKFNKSEKSGEALDRVYNQLADCYYYNYDFAHALEYARKAIEHNRTFIKPYNRMFNVYMRLRKYNKAAGILEEYMEHNTKSVFVQYMLANHYLKKLKKYDQAEEAFERVIAISDVTPIEDYYRENSLFYLGFIAYKNGDRDAAIDYYNRVLRLNRSNQGAIQSLAGIHMDEYELDDALKYARMFLKQNPDSKKMHSLMGRIYYLKRHADALRHLRLGKNTGSIDGLVAWGLYFELLKYDEKALKVLDKVLEYVPGFASVHLGLAEVNLRKGDEGSAFNELLTAGVILYKKKRFEESHHAFSRASRLNDTVPGVFYYLGRIHEELGNRSLAIVNYKKAYSLKPDDNLLLHIGYLFGSDRDYESAFQYFNLASDRDPKNSRPFFYKGLVSIWKEDYSRAETNIRHAITLDEKTGAYYFYLAVVFDKRKKLTEAIQYLEKAIEYDPESARAYNYLGYLYADNNMEIDRSLVLIRKAIELDPDNGAYTDSLGWAYYRKGNYDKALEKLLLAEKLLKKNNVSDPVVYDHIGDTYEKLGDRTNAVKYWKRSISIEDNPAIQEKIKKFNNP